MKFLVTALPMLATGAAIAGPLSVERYVDPQGVEIIHNRKQGGGEKQTPPAIDLAPGKAPSTAPSIRAAEPDRPERDPRFQISRTEQSVRDGDRAMILQQELLIESQKFEETRKRLNVQRLRDSGAEAELARLNEDLNRHQQNIRALNAELRRMAQSRSAVD